MFSIRTIFVYIYRNTINIRVQQHMAHLSSGDFKMSIHVLKYIFCFHVSSINAFTVTMHLLRLMYEIITKFCFWIHVLKNSLSNYDQGMFGENFYF